MPPKILCRIEFKNGDKFITVRNERAINGFKDDIKKIRGNQYIGLGLWKVPYTDSNLHFLMTIAAEHYAARYPGSAVYDGNGVVSVIGKYQRQEVLK